MIFYGRKHKIRHIMKWIQKLAALLLTVLPVLSLSAQPVSGLLTGYVRNINQFNRLNPQEKVYLHFDNTGYYIGETIWFKAYVVDAAHHENTSLSRVLYVELLTPQGIVADSRKLKITDGQCHGEFRLGGKYRSGFYEVRAYTRSMLNFGDECMFSRVFPVYRMPRAAGDYADKKMEASNILVDERAKPEKHSRIDLAFYPEGGNAVVGLRSRIAFKATGDNGQNLNITGTVYNENDEPVATLTTLHQGMGFFELTPETGTYKVVAECEGKKRNFSFTEIVPTGYVMQADHLNDTTLQIRVQKSPALPADTVALSVSCRGKVYAAKIIQLQNDRPLTFHLSKTGMPAGCLQLTLFDRQGTVLSERLIFNTGTTDYLSVAPVSGKTAFKPLKRVQMEFQVKDKTGKPATPGFSLAIRDAETELHTAYEDNILTDLLLSSDLKGYIENPMQYFTNPGRDTRIRLDLLMLVQGWRRYNWQVMAGITPLEVKYFAEEGLDISGKVVEWSKNKIKTGGTVTYWMLKDGEAFHGKCKTDENGRFHFVLPDDANIGQKRSLGLQYNVNGKRKHCRILLDRPSPQGRSYTFNDTYVKDTVVTVEEQADSLKTSISETQYLEEAVVQQEKPKPDLVFDVERDINALQDKGAKYPGTVGEYLESKVAAIGGAPGYTYGNQKTIYLYANHHSHDADRKTPSSDRPNTEHIPAPEYDIEDVRKIDVYYKNKTAWHKIICPLCFGRIPHEPAVLVLVKLYNDNLHGQYRTGIRQTYYNGYSVSKEFYHVDNSDKFPGETDFRRTLYWNPDVKPDKQGKIKISFYNNSHCKRANFSAEGITQEGRFIIGGGNVGKSPTGG